MIFPAIAASLLFLLQIPNGSIVGTVLSSTTNKPVAGARITAIKSQISPDLAGAISSGLIVGSLSRQAPSPPNLSAETDINGRFVLQAVEPGTYIVNATADGYARQQVGSSPYGKADMMLPVTVTAGQPAGNVVFHLMPAGNVSGRVTGTDGEPLVGMEVTLFHATYSIGGRKNFSQMGSAQTNDRGEYRAFWVMPGKYYLSVVASSRPMVGINPVIPSAQNNKYPRTFYPGVTEMDGATEFEITPGSELSGMDVHLSAHQSYVIRGRVVDSSTGQFPPSAGISIVSRDQAVGGITSSTAPYNRTDGTFELRNVFAGSYWIRAQLPSMRPPNPGERPPFQPSTLAAVDVSGSDIDNVVLTIMPPVSIQGRMRIEGPPSNDGPWSVSLMPAAPMMLSPMSEPARVQPDGTFRIDNIGPGEYQVSVPGLGPMPAGNGGRRLYIKEARIGSTDLLTEALKIPSGATGEVQIVLSRNTGEISGTVRDERQQPAGPVQIVLVPDNRDRRDLYRIVLTGINGQFTIQGVPPASYKIFALAPPDVTSFFDPAVMKKLEPGAQHVTVGESSTLTVDLKVLRSPER